MAHRSLINRSSTITRPTPTTHHAINQPTGTQSSIKQSLDACVAKPSTKHQSIIRQSLADQ
eukprot:6642120-Lingulodinium_polyedra.AAC.1